MIVDAVFHWTAASFTFSSLVVFAGLRADPASVNNPTLSQMVTAIHSLGWWLYPILAILLGVTTWLESYVGQPKTWEIVEKILDRQRGILFGSLENERHHHHRVTLFKYKKHLVLKPWKWSSPGWLVPVARCSSRNRKGIPVFRASKDNPDKVEGVVGEAWSQRDMYQVFDLPDLNTLDTSNKDFIEHAESTGVTEEWLRNRQKKGRNAPRSLLAMPIEVNGSIWGVLVVDSMSSEEINTRGVNTREFRALVTVLSEVVRYV